MATREIDEVEFQRNEDLKKTVAALMKHPKSRRKMLEAQKEVFPDTPIPELDAAEPLTAAVNEIRKEFSDYRKSVEEERAKEREEKRLSDLESRWNKGQETLRRDYKVTTDGLKAVEDFMKEHAIIDHEIGWAAFTKLNPPPEPASPSGGTGAWDIIQNVPDDDKYLKRLIDSRGEDEGAVNALVGQALDEVRGVHRR